MASRYDFWLRNPFSRESSRWNYPPRPRRHSWSDYFDEIGLPCFHEYDDEEDDDVPVAPVKPKPKPPKPDAQTLKVTKCDYNISQNTNAHHTDEYDITAPPSEKEDAWEKATLVVRRGQPFDITLHFTRPYDKKNDDLRLIFEFGKEPQTLKGTYIEMILSDDDLSGQWGAKIKDQKDNQLTITIFTPATLYVGEWKLKVDFIQKRDKEKALFRFSSKRPIYILFNPWCKDDAVFMPDDTQLNEYVLNETGLIYVGRYTYGRPWNYGQFDGNILLCILYLLSKHDAPLNVAHRGDPVHVVRKLSAMINDMDNDGVLAGNWSGEYGGGTSPLEWKGSVKIFKEFWASKRPVKYGQCWVFSGLLTTACRAIGIPARSVTNFGSAHDTDGSMTIDEVRNAEGEKIGYLSPDSIWNFHVWNDAWMKRGDLPNGYDGWQAIDATPQEESEGVYCCGPCPLVAIKKGEVNIPYDGKFIFAEVNGDKMIWEIEEDGTYKLTKILKYTVGKFISTKEPMVKKRQDVTLEYKFEEGSAEERISVKNANRRGSSKVKDVYKMPENADVKFELTVKEVMYGDDIDVVLTIENTSKETRTVSGYINAYTMDYTRHVHDKVKKQKHDNILQGKDKKTLILKVTEEEYMEKLADQCGFEICGFFKVKETGQTSVEDIDFSLQKPSLLIKAPAEGRVGEPLKVEVSFTNSLNVSLTDCHLSYEGAGLVQETNFKKRNLAGKATYRDQFEIIPKKKGERNLLVSFNAKQIKMVEGSCEIRIKP